MSEKTSIQPPDELWTFDKAEIHHGGLGLWEIFFFKDGRSGWSHVECVNTKRKAQRRARRVLQDGYLFRPPKETTAVETITKTRNLGHV
jgi:hypothetical protein